MPMPIPEPSGSPRMRVTLPPPPQHLHRSLCHVSASPSPPPLYYHSTPPPLLVVSGVGVGVGVVVFDGGGGAARAARVAGAAGARLAPARRPLHSVARGLVLLRPCCRPCALRPPPHRPHAALRAPHLPQPRSATSSLTFCKQLEIAKLEALERPVSFATPISAPEVDGGDTVAAGGIRPVPGRPAAAAAAGGGDVVAGVLSDDDRSVAADSWSIKSDYGSTLDDDQRHADAADVLSTSHFPPASDYSSDKDVPDATDVEPSMVGLQNYWMILIQRIVQIFKNKAMQVKYGLVLKQLMFCDIPKDLSSWSVLDVGTGNGLLLQELAKQGFSDLTGTDYSEEAIEHARNLAVRNGFSQINFLVDDVLETKLERKFRLVNDKYTLDAIGLHPDGHVKRMMYWESVAHLVVPGGILVITSCNSTKDELVQEVENFNQRQVGSAGSDGNGEPPCFGISIMSRCILPQCEAGRKGLAWRPSHSFAKFVCFHLPSSSFPAAAAAAAVSPLIDFFPLFLS
uniref:Methyltransferase domain-containing protein n=1 Tax=Ananas comosus var. bracteatus TaxID=296719 RepID=A0A6V7NW87_ANACO|nr:unnamed protein product [Ananas comosus var. bracteatus]